jgi:hypothetical protein
VVLRSACDPGATHKSSLSINSICYKIEGVVTKKHRKAVADRMLEVDSPILLHHNGRPASNKDPINC